MAKHEISVTFSKTFQDDVASNSICFSSFHAWPPICIQTEIFFKKESQQLWKKREKNRKKKIEGKNIEGKKKKEKG